jgi:epoxyqueuosine reductase
MLESGSGSVNQKEAVSNAGSQALAIKALAVQAGFELVGIAPLQPSTHAAFYQRWLAEGRHGEMSYLARPAAVARRLDPRAELPELRSAIVVGLNYHTDAEAPRTPGHGIIARYARGRDYHKVIKRKLLDLLERIEQLHGDALPAARAYVDTGPVLERELAQRAGLGWFGRNTMLIHPKRGSFFFLGVLLVELDLECDEPFAADHCGSCNACLTACPTGALLGRDANGAPVIDATRCISYLTIEQRGLIPPELRPLVGDRIFGCDICQDVCPWNGPKFVQLTKERSFTARPDTSRPRLIELMQMDDAAWDTFSAGSPIRRAKRSGFLRNVAVALGNWGEHEAVPALIHGLADNEPIVRAHAAWALGRIDTPDARAALRARAAIEKDELVLEEVRVALPNGKG